MPQASQEVVIIPLQTITASGTSADIVVPDRYKHVIFKLGATGTVSGTSPTLNVFIQQKLGTPAATDAVGSAATGTATYDDCAAFTQITAASSQVLRLSCEGSNGQGTTQPTAASDAALTAGTVRNGPLGRVWRAKWTVGGTTPSFGGASLCAVLIP